LKAVCSLGIEGGGDNKRLYDTKFSTQ